MRLTLENDYAYRIILKFSSIPSGSKLVATELSEELSIPERFTYRILRKLMLSGLLDSIRGAHGGYVLAKNPKDITLYDVYKAISGEILINTCLINPEACDATPGYCAVHNELFTIQSEIQRLFSSVSFEELAERNLSLEECHTAK